MARTILVVMRLEDMYRVHPRQKTYKCHTCGHDVGIYPSGQDAIARNKDIVVLCQVCIKALRIKHGDRIDVVSPEVFKEIRESKPKEQDDANI